MPCLYTDPGIIMNRKKIKTELLIHDLKNPLAVVQAGIEGLIAEIRCSFRAGADRSL